MKDTFVAKTGTSVADVKDCLYCLCRSSLTSSSWKLVAVPWSSVVVFWVRCVIEASLWCTGPPESAQAISLHPPASRTQVSPCFPHGRMGPGQSVWKWLEKMRMSKRTFVWTFIIRSGCFHTFNLSAPVPPKSFACFLKMILSFFAQHRRLRRIGRDVDLKNRLFRKKWVNQITFHNSILHLEIDEQSTVEILHLRDGVDPRRNKLFRSVQLYSHVL